MCSLSPLDRLHNSRRPISISKSEPWRCQRNEMKNFECFRWLFRVVYRDTRVEREKKKSQTFIVRVATNAWDVAVVPCSIAFFMLLYHLSINNSLINFQGYVFTFIFFTRLFVLGFSGTSSRSCGSSSTSIHSLACRRRVVYSMWSVQLCAHDYGA